MTDYKCSTFDYLRRRLGEVGVSEDSVLSQLSPDDGELFRSALPLTWAPGPAAGRVLRAACLLIAPHDPNPLHEVGRAMAGDHMNGMYRLLLRFTSISTVVEKAATLWSTFHKRGKARVEHRPSENCGIFIVEDYPSFDANIRANVGGYIQGLIELTGAKSVNVKENESSHDTWRWIVHWS